ncbi:MAG: hypothetical protein ABI882_03170 [Acidobacteriota bacterium]
MNIELSIEELVLEGFDPRDRYRIADELQRVLTAALRDSEKQGDGRREAQIDRLDAGSVTLPKDAPVQEVGVQVGSAIMRALNGRALNGQALDGRSR